MRSTQLWPGSESGGKERGRGYVKGCRQTCVGKELQADKHLSGYPYNVTSVKSELLRRVGLQAVAAPVTIPVGLDEADGTGVTLKAWWGFCP